MTNGDRAHVASKLLNQAEEEQGNPSHANTLALIGIGNALLQIAEALGDLDHLNTLVGSLDQIAHTPSNHTERPWG
jgi:hypothetical protein